MTTTTTWAIDTTAGQAGQSLLNICIIFAILETVFVIVFVFSWHYNRDNGSGGTKTVYVLVLLGYVFCFGGVVMGILKLSIGGAGRHFGTVRPQTAIRMLQLLKAHEVIYMLSLSFPKLAILCLYFRLFDRYEKVAKIVLYATALLILGTAVFGVVVAFTNCRPFTSFWDVTGVVGMGTRCTMDPMTAMRYYSVPNIGVDAALLVIPLPALIRLSGGMWRKICVGLTFVFSTLGIVTAILRFTVFLRTDLFQDATYYSVPITNWSIIEPGVHLICATVLTLRPLLHRLFTHILPPTAPKSPSRSRSASIPFSVLHLHLNPPTPSRPSPAKKSSTRDLVPTLGRAASRIVHLDDYHYMQWKASGVYSVRSDDEESMVCADAVVWEAMGRQGRNPDGTLVGWSLGPVEGGSPLRASFLGR